MTIYKHPTLTNYVKHYHGNMYVECDKEGKVLLERRIWQISPHPRPQYRLITDKSKLKEI